MPFSFFSDCLWKNRINRRWWMVGMAAFILQFILFKLYYPFANYMPDSYSYLQAAFTNVDVNMWPVAYSKFLRLISVFTHFDTVVVGLQYFFLQVSSLLLLFSLLYFQPPGKTVRVILLLFVLLNPVPLYVANYISADALFIGFSLLWLTSLIWIIYRPHPGVIIAHALLLLACFTLRYNAIYYPLISLMVFILSRQSWKYKLTGIALGTGLVLLSVLYTSQKMRTITGKRQFSAFGGWQLANNALYMYEHIPARDRGPVPPRFAGLEGMVREHMDTLKKVKFNHDDTVSSFFYLWSGKGPLIQYLTRQYKKDSTTPYFDRWASEGPLYSDYAFWLIRKHPWQYAEYFILPNAVKYAVPPAEFLGTYNMGGDSVGKLAKDWFNYKSLRVKKNNKKDASIPAVEWYPIFSTIVNLLFVLGLISMVILEAVQWQEYGLPQLLIVVLLLWTINLGFSIFVSPIVLRYQVFPLFVSFLISVLLFERIWRIATTDENPYKV